MIPLFQKTAAFTATRPPATHYYLLASNGLFVVQDTALFRATTRIARRHPLLPAEPSLELRLPRIPTAVMEQAYGFFREVYRRHHGEALVQILYTPDRAAFQLVVPPQRLTYYADSRTPRIAMGVHYEPIAKPPGAIILGDIHSHGAHPAYFSHTDDHDDLDREGLHIVLGRLHSSEPDCCVSFVTNQTRFDLDRNAILEPFTTPLPPPASWLERVRIERVSTLHQQYLPPPQQGANERP